jgi:hypothetical protein
LLVEADGDESDQFALLLAYLERIAIADEGNACLLQYNNDGTFEAVAFAPATTQNACRFIRHFACLDSCHTSSKYRMMLLIATSIDANDNALPLSWAIVPTENEEWWLWFCSFLKEQFDPISKPSFVFISDREKGISTAISEVFPSAFHRRCCQHIADNV